MGGERQPGDPYAVLVPPHRMNSSNAGRAMRRFLPIVNDGSVPSPMSRQTMLGPQWSSQAASGTV